MSPYTASPQIMFTHGRWLLTRPVDVFVKDLFMLYFVSF